MNFNYYLFDLDNSILNIPNPSEYFDNILLEAIKTFSVKELPQREERNNFWHLGDHYIELLKKWGVNLKDYGEFWKKFDSIDFENRKNLIEKNQISLFPDVNDVIRQLSLSKKKMAIVSNTASYIVDFILDKFKINDFFHDAFGLGYGKDQGIAKPSPEGIKLTLSKLKYNPNKSSAIMIGDSIVDIFAAKRANIYACLLKRDIHKYPNGYNNWKHKPDYITENLYEVLDL